MSVLRFFKKHRKIMVGLSHFVPASALVKIHYKNRTGRKLNLRNPERLSEKLYWYKLFYRTQLMKDCSDKYKVRKYVESCGLGSILNECYGVWDRPEDIPFDSLPQQFVLKDTLGAANNGILFCFDKDKYDFDKARSTLNTWIIRNDNRTVLGGDWFWEGRNRIIAEKLLIVENGDLPDYKFFCFNGKVYCSYYMRNYTSHPEEGENGFLDRDFNLLDVHRTDYKPLSTRPQKPKNYDKMVEIAEKLAQPFPHVRVDLYNLDGQIVFGELTFVTNAGVIPFSPDSFDYTMGKQFDLPPKKVEKIDYN